MTSFTEAIRKNKLSHYGKIHALGKRLESILTTDEKELLYAYSDSTYKEINRFLYGNTEDMDVYKNNVDNPEEHHDYIQTRIDLLDEIFEKSVLPQPITVYRGLNAARAGFCGKNYENPDIERAVGKTYTFNGYVSTSASWTMALGFRGHESPAMLQIDLPAGTHAIPMTSMLSSYADEQEVLLARNTQIKISRVVMEKSRYYRIFGEFIR